MKDQQMKQSRSHIIMYDEIGVDIGIMIPQFRGAARAQGQSAQRRPALTVRVTELKNTGSGFDYAVKNETQSALLTATNFRHTSLRRRRTARLATGVAARPTRKVTTTQLEHIRHNVVALPENGSAPEGSNARRSDTRRDA
jgi:hypothetical protein